MKKIMMLFLLVSFMCFGEDKVEPKKSYEVIQREEIDFLKTQLIKSNNKIDDLSKKIEKLEDKGENNLGLTYNVDQIYQNSVQYYDKTISHVKWIAGIAGFMISLLLTGLLGSTWYIKKVGDKELKEKIQKETSKLDKKFSERINEYDKKMLESEEKVESLKQEYEKNIISIKKDVEKVEFNTELAIAINKSDPKEKIEELKKLVEKYSEKAKVYLELGSSLEVIKKYEEAIVNYKKAKVLGVEENIICTLTGFAYYNWGNENNKGKKYIDAKKHFEYAKENLEEAIELGGKKSTLLEELVRRIEKKLKELEGK